MKKLAWCAVMLLTLFGVARVGCAESDPVIDNSHSTQRLQNPQRPSGPRTVVTIYEFRSAVPEVNGANATDMFITALMKSGAFAVAERARLSEGVMREKQLNAAERTTGNTASRKIAGARYIFEGAVTESNVAEQEQGGGFSIGGMEVGGGTRKDAIGIDVRVVEVDSGTVVDAVNVRKAIDSSGTAVAGVGNLLSSIRALSGRGDIPLNPDVNYRSSRRESVDKALRACIEFAVAELVQRYAGN